MRIKEKSLNYVYKKSQSGQIISLPCSVKGTVLIKVLIALCNIKDTFCWVTKVKLQNIRQVLFYNYYYFLIFHYNYHIISQFCNCIITLHGKLIIWPDCDFL